MKRPAGERIQLVRGGDHNGSCIGNGRDARALNEVSMKLPHDFYTSPSITARTAVAQDPDTGGRALTQNVLESIIVARRRVGRRQCGLLPWLQVLCLVVTRRRETDVAFPDELLIVARERGERAVCRQAGEHQRVREAKTVGRLCYLLEAGFGSLELLGVKIAVLQRFNAQKPADFGMLFTEHSVGSSTLQQRGIGFEQRKGNSGSRQGSVLQRGEWLVDEKTTGELVAGAAQQELPVW